MYKSLTGHDYMTNPIRELTENPDFNQEALRLVIDVGRMTSDELRNAHRRLSSYIYCTSKNSGPTWGKDPLLMLYLGTSVKDAEEAVGDFSRYQVEEDRFPRDPNYYTALSYNLEKEIIQFYMADGWWYSIFRFKL